MSTIYISAFALGALSGLLIIAAVAAALWPLAEWEKKARLDWADGDVTVTNRLFWRLFRPLTVSAVVLGALGGAA